MADQLILDQTSFFLHSGYGLDENIKVYKGSNGNKIYKGVPVFRTGTFSDSMGYVQTWESLHLDQMIDNNSYLSKNLIVPQWPTRDGHSAYLLGGVQGRGNVVGWIQNMETKKLKSPLKNDDEKYTYLLNDYEVTEPYAQEKLDNGTWKHRSSEIGTYKTNNQVELAPTFMGFAFVDIPAVEGLNFSTPNRVRFYVDLGGANFTKEKTTVDPTGTVVPDLPFHTAPSGNQTATPPAQHAAPNGGTPAPFTFSCNGVSLSDPTLVQAYINKFEAFMTEHRTATRQAFVNGLVVANKIPAPQEAEYFKHALTLNDEQYGFWCGTMSSGPVIGTLAAHGAGQATHGQQASPNAPVAPQTQAIQDAKDRIKMHRSAGTSQKVIETTPGWKLLQAAGITV